MYFVGGYVLDRIGTRRGFFLLMLFWTLACASQGLAGGVVMLAACRLLLGMGEGGGFPAATRVTAEWFPPEERATAMGIFNAGSAVGSVAAAPLIALVLSRAGWLHLAPWRWVFFLAGSLGLVWSALWWRLYYTPAAKDAAAEPPRVPLSRLLARREIWGLVGAKFMTDAAWYFYLFWLPKYLFDAWHFDFKAAGTIGWIPYAASGVGSLLGGGLSSRLLRRGASVNASRKIAMGVSVALMPWVILVPHLPSLAAVIVLFSLAFWGQQSWSTLVMILPTDLVPRSAVGTIAGLIGCGGALGGVVFGQLAGYLLDHGFSYAPILAIAGCLHVAGFLTICLAIPRIRPLSFATLSPTAAA